MLDGSLTPFCANLGENPLDGPSQGSDRQPLSCHTLRLFIGQLPLPLPEQRGADPRPGARISIPILVVALDQRLANQRLSLPGAQIPCGVVARVDVDEGVGAVVPECRGPREPLDV